MATIWPGSWSTGVGVTGRGDNGFDPPWFGWYYGSFLPHFRWNGGKPWRGEVLDIGWFWLCFHGSFTRWPHR